MLRTLVLTLALLAPAVWAANPTTKPVDTTKSAATPSKPNSSQSTDNPEKTATAAEPGKIASNPKVALHTTMGDIVVELYADKAPKSVENFLQYVKEGFYNGTVFHRIIDNFMVQGGGFTKELVQKRTHAPIHNEANNGLSNLRGTLAMARTNDPHSATAQFFINVVDNKRLDYTGDKDGLTWGYCVFGKIVSGMDVVDKMKAVPTAPQGPLPKDVPTTPITLEKVELLQ